MSEGCYGVSFLDDRKREHLMYAFEDTGGGKLFLNEALNREFERVTDEVARGTTYRFSVDGRVRIERADKPFREATVTETQADVSKNWEARPSFGEYTRLIRKDR